MIDVVIGSPFENAPRFYVNLNLPKGVPDQDAVIRDVARELALHRSEIEEAMKLEGDHMPVQFRVSFPIGARTFMAWMALSRLLLDDAPVAAHALVSMARNHGEDQARAIMKTLQAEGWIGAFGGRPALRIDVDAAKWPKSGTLKL